MDQPLHHSLEHNSEPPAIGQLARQACLWEATARKPGNVHPTASFSDTNYDDFVISAQAIGPAMQAAVSQGVGTTVWQAVSATCSVVSSNTNLGLILLLAPLATVPHNEPLRPGVERVLESLSGEDSKHIYDAIRLAQPGGIGEVDGLDIQESPPENLIAAMQEASSWDLIAKQYCQGFVDLFDLLCPWIEQGLTNGWTLPECIVHCHIQCMATFPDSLIARKCGLPVAQESQRRAQAVLDCGNPTTGSYQQASSDLDQWLRADGPRRNPGTTADMTGAALFIGLRHGTIDKNLSASVSGDNR
ncbi:MAG: triphosphoribosyl-dephospho-CoA synthase [Pirellulaceae bacterium]